MWPKNDFTRKMIDFEDFTKIAYECWRLGQINGCQRLLKLAQSPINCTIWSHCPWSTITTAKRASPRKITRKGSNGKMSSLAGIDQN